ncbi:MAG: EAL domain-containing protein [Actinomycetota bacterium]
MKRNDVDVRVLVADDEPFTRDSLVELIGSDPGLEVVGRASDAEEAIDVARMVRPDVALVDARMPEGGGRHAARRLRDLDPEIRVVALSAARDRETVLDMLTAGACGYIVKGTPPEEILDTIHRAAAGVSFLSAEITGDVLEELTAQLEREDVKAKGRGVKEARIWRILKGDGLNIVFQPILRLSDRSVVGYEALSRFDAPPERGPDRWFDEAAEVEMLVDLEIAAVEAVASNMAMLPSDAYCAMNLSPPTAASPALAEMLESIPTERVTLEITEHASVEDYTELNASLRDLRIRGMRLAIDDAGAGFSSMRHILLLRPDVIKLDMSLTRDVDTDESRRSLARAMISFAGDVGADIVAEGIETKDELETLRSLGVGYGQGYLLGRPAPMIHSRPRVLPAGEDRWSA